MRAKRADLSRRSALEEKKVEKVSEHDKELQELLSRVPPLFSSCQHNTEETHVLKALDTLHSIFISAADVTTPTRNGQGLRLTGEKAFLEMLVDMVARVFTVKGGVAAGDNTVRFLAAFVAYAVDHDRREEGEEEDEEEADPPSSRLVSQLLAFLLPGFLAKDSTVRFRSVQLVALIVNSIGEIDQDSFNLLKNSLIERVWDTDPNIRMQAADALAKFQEAEGDGDEDEGSDTERSMDDDDSFELSDDGSSSSELESKPQNVVDVLIDVLIHDPEDKVRKKALLSIVPSPKTMLSLLSRIVDIAPRNRVATFNVVLPRIPFKHLTGAQREEIVQKGIVEEREDSVKKAAKTLLGAWADEVGGIESLLGYFDLEAEDGAIVRSLLFALFESRPDLLQPFAFDDHFYETITPARAAVLQSYFAYLRHSNDPALEDLHPVLTRLAFLIRTHWNDLLVKLDDSAECNDSDSILFSYLVLTRLIEVAVAADYGDEMGRRAMFGLMRELLSHEKLPPPLIPKCEEVILKGGITEREFVPLIVEIIQVLRADSALLTSESENDPFRSEDDDDTEENESTEEDSTAGPGHRRKGVKPSKAKGPAHVERRKELDLRCLAVFRALLERVMGDIMEENSMARGLVVDIVVPAVRSKDVEVRYEGLRCLALVCLVDKATALDSFELFMKSVADDLNSENPFKVLLLQAVFDILVLYGVDFCAARGFGADTILDVLRETLEPEDPEVAVTAVTGFAKLLLFNFVKDEEVLSRLAYLNFGIETVDNPELRQCLTYFFPTYCHSSAENQRRVASVLISSLLRLKNTFDHGEDKASMIEPLQIGLQLLEWTDPQYCLKSEHFEPDVSIHADLAVEMMDLLLKFEEKDKRKLLCQLLDKLNIPETVEAVKIKSIMSLIASVELSHPLTDAVSKSALTRFQKKLRAIFGSRLEALEDVDLRSAEELAAVHDLEEEEEEEGGTSEDEVVELGDDEESEE